LIGTFLALRGFQIFKLEGFKFLTSSDWNVVTDDSGKQTFTFGIAAMLLGTVLIAITALSIGVPLSVLTALYSNFYAPERIKKYLTAVIDLMAAFLLDSSDGLWGYFCRNANGYSPGKTSF
jgi:phosphate transport system permease protein